MTFFFLVQDAIYSKFKKRKKSVPVKEKEIKDCAPGDEITRELEDAWYLYTKVILLESKEKVKKRVIGKIVMGK